MKRFFVNLLKLAFVVAIALLIYEFFPVLVVPFLLLAGSTLVVGGALSGGLLIALGIAFVLMIVVGVLMLGLVGLLSPLWLPILALVGLIALIRALSRRTA